MTELDQLEREVAQLLGVSGSMRQSPICPSCGRTHVEVLANGVTVEIGHHPLCNCWECHPGRRQ